MCIYFEDESTTEFYMMEFQSLQHWLGFCAIIPMCWASHKLCLSHSAAVLVWASRQAAAYWTAGLYGGLIPSGPNCMLTVTAPVNNFRTSYDNIFIIELTRWYSSNHFLHVFHQTESEVTTDLTLAIPTSGVMSAFLTHHI